MCSLNISDYCFAMATSQIDGHHYFHCKENRGLLLPASQVTWHGHSVAKVLKKEDFNLASTKDVQEAVVLARREGIAKQWD